MFFPNQWAKVAYFLRLNRAESGLEKGSQSSGHGGAVIIGASLGPVFSTCSPTYSLILAIVLPESFSVGLLNLGIYTVGMGLPLLLIAYGGRGLVEKFKLLANPNSAFKKILATLLLIT